jgi:hypothetical protein
MATEFAGERARGRGALWALVILGGLVLFGAAGLHSLNVDPNVSVPNPAMPSPNAFDYDLRAGQSLRDARSIDSYFNGSNLESPTITADPAVAAIVSDNADSLGLVRQSFTHTYQNPPVRSFSTTMPYFGLDRRLARLLVLQATQKEAAGDWYGAAGCGLDAIRLGVDLPHGSSLIGELVGIFIEAMGRKAVWRTLSHLTAAQTRAAKNRLTAILSRRVPLADTLQEEEWQTEASLQDVMRQPNWQANLVSGSSGNMDLPRLLSLAFISKRSVMRDYRFYMGIQIRDARLPYAIQNGSETIPAHLNAVDQVVIPVFGGAKLKTADTQAKDELLETALALREYRDDHGAYPATLSALVPVYLPVLPPDPFAVSGPLQYRLSGPGYALYSVGPDGKDDGGRPIDNPSSTRYNVARDSRGDIVAGVNM